MNNGTNETCLLDLLTSRERTVLRLSIQDLSCKEIAAQLGIEEDTVQQHRKNVIKKAGVNGKIGFRRLLRRLESCL